MAFVETISGNPSLTFNETEMAARLNARRSIVAQGTIPAGSAIEAGMITFKRPGTGIAPSRLDEVLGRRALVEIGDDTILQWDMLS